MLRALPEVLLYPVSSTVGIAAPGSLDTMCGVYRVIVRCRILSSLVHEVPCRRYQSSECFSMHNHATPVH